MKNITEFSRHISRD